MPKKVLLTGGGTLGSVTPLLTIKEALERAGRRYLAEEKIDFFWIGTKNGPERKIINKEGIKFLGISSGKWRRYFDFRNFIAPFFVLLGFLESLFILRRIKPDIVITAGSFVSVPVALAASFLKIPILVHQLDVRPGLANKIMSRWAKKITVGFQETLSSYPSRKAVWTGNPMPYFPSTLRPSLPLPLKSSRPLILVIGGGTGAQAINELVKEILPSLTKIAQVVHLTGQGKSSSFSSFPYYYPFEFLSNKDILTLYPYVDLVICRGGLGTLLELAAFGKPAIIIPIPHSHQEDNARIVKEKRAALVLNQEKLTPQSLLQNIKKILYNKTLKEELSFRIKRMNKKNSNQEIVKIIKEIW